MQKMRGEASAPLRIFLYLQLSAAYPFDNYGTPNRIVDILSTERVYPLAKNLEKNHRRPHGSDLHGTDMFRRRHGQGQFRKKRQL